MNSNDATSPESAYATPKLQKVSSVRSSCSVKSSHSRSKKSKSVASDDDGCSIRVPVGISRESAIPNISHVRRKISFNGLAELNLKGATGLALAHLFDEINEYKERKLIEVEEMDESGVEECEEGLDTCEKVYSPEDGGNGDDGQSEDDENLFYTEDDLRRLFQERDISVRVTRPLNGVVDRERNIQPETFYHPDYQEPETFYHPDHQEPK